ncbi:helix-turn-helix domain-containing protein [Micromonospora carbonacea]|uniref:hypothetical protein n=1 Tax=Micromonospora carbonacea TaxID=47853 RepID=UPI00371B4E70
MAGFNCGQHRTYTAGCRGCQRVDSHYDRRRRRLIAEGKWQHPVPVGNVLTHVEQLRDSGMSLASVARAAGVAPRTLYSVVHERRKTIRATTAALVLAVQPAATLPAGMVHAVGVTRRIRALVAAGYSLTAVARGLDKQLQAVWEWAWAKQQMVTVDTHRAVCDLYDRWSLTPGTNVRARNTGRRNGWAPPLAWDDAALDDPDGTPYDADPAGDARIVDWEAIRRALSGEPANLTRLERHHAVHRGQQAGMTLAAIQRALRMSGSYVNELAHRPLPTYSLAA